MGGSGICMNMVPLIYGYTRTTRLTTLTPNVDYELQLCIRYLCKCLDCGFQFGQRMFGRNQHYHPPLLGGMLIWSTQILLCFRKSEIYISVNVAPCLGRFVNVQASEFKIFISACLHFDWEHIRQSSFNRGQNQNFYFDQAMRHNNLLHVLAV